MSSTITVPEVSTSTVTETAAERLQRTSGAVRVHFTWWGVRKTLTKEQKEEMARTYGAKAKSVSGRKVIIDTEHKAFGKLTTIKGQITKYWKNITLPYVESGVRLIPQSRIESFRQIMQEKHAELQEAEANFDQVFADIREEASESLGRLYNPSDYPAAIRGLFNVEWDFVTTEPPSYLMHLDPAAYEEERQRIARRFEESVQLAEDAFLAEFNGLVTHLTDCLAAGPDGEKKIFRDSAVNNFTTFFAKFRLLNVRSNAQLDDLVEQASRLVSNVKPDQLRSNDSIRQLVATQMSVVGSALEGMIITQPRRRIIRSTEVENAAPN